VTRPRSSTSTRKARTARANGQRGGRPRGKLPRALLAKLGPPPASAIELGRWLFRVNAEVAWLVMNGQIGSDLAENIRACAAATLRAMPADELDALARQLRDEGDALDGADPGPQLSRRNDAARSPALRRDAR
jgi:hypothetical protein